MSERAGVVVAECPLCVWRSEAAPIGDEVNGEWHARQVAATEYRQHFDDHRPMARFVKAYASGPSTPGEQDDDPNVYVGPASDGS